MKMCPELETFVWNQEVCIRWWWIFDPEIYNTEVQTSEVTFKILVVDNLQRLISISAAETFILN